MSERHQAERRVLDVLEGIAPYPHPDEVVQPGSVSWHACQASGSVHRLMGWGDETLTIGQLAALADLLSSVGAVTQAAVSDDVVSTIV